jgi:hypothetical protein
MKCVNFKVLTILLIPVVTSVPVLGLVTFGAEVSSLQEIQKSFPDSIHMGAHGEQSIEFCPDNTCDFFIATNKVPLETLEDFAYLFIYFFSDYYVLDKWRSRKEPILVARRILSKASYQVCKIGNEEESARCLLRHLSEKNQIQLYAVRYDENTRSLVHKNVFEATSMRKAIGVSP